MKLFGSLLFRFTLAYAVILSASLGMLLGAYYYTSVHLPMRAMKAKIETEVGDLIARYGDGSSPAMLEALRARAIVPGDGTAYHILISKDGRVLARNLATWPEYNSTKWSMIEADTFNAGEENDHMALMLDGTLSDGSRLLIGRDIEVLQERRRTLVAAAELLIAGSVLLGLLGGGLMSRAIGARIDSINRTARRVMEGDLSDRIPTRGTTDDFDRLAETLNIMLARIERLVQSVRRVSDSVAHEMRTPLTRLHADLSDLARGGAESQPGLIEDAMAEAENLVALFDAVLRIGRIETVDGPLETDRVSVPELLNDVAEIFSVAAEDKGINLSVEAAEPVAIVANRNLVFQALGNVVDNAVKFTPDGGNVRLTAAIVGHTVHLCVSDDGVGIPEEERRNVFERFVRLPATSHVSGLGLGLSFVKAVADVHQSEIVLTNGDVGLLFCWMFEISTDDGN